MRLVRGFLSIVTTIVAALSPLSTLIACLALLLLSVHVAAAPVTHLARTVLDLVDAGVDALLIACIKLWSGVFDWKNARIESTTEMAVSFIDVPEKLAAVHSLGLVVEGALLWVFFPFAWRADVWRWPSLHSPSTMVAQARDGWRRLPKWVRVERVILAGLLVCGVVSAAGETRAAAVSFSASFGVALEWLRTAGWGAFVVAGWVALVYAALPMIGTPAGPSTRAGRWRRIVVLLSLLLVVAAAVEALW